MMDKEKLNKLHIHAEQLIKSASNDGMKNAGTIIQLLVTHVDNLNDEVEWLKEENEKLRFDLQDIKIEKSLPRGRSRRTNSIT